MDFRYYINEAEKKMAAGDLQHTLSKIPKDHRNILKGYKYAVEDGNTLKGDDGHIGLNDLDKQHIKVAAPWNYGREFALLHEIGHSVWAKYIANCKHRQEEWKKIAKRTKGKVNQNAEELFCHAYANTYSKNKIEVHNHPEWEKFIKSLH